MHADTNSELNLLREQVATLQAALLQSRRENAFLRQKVDALVRRVFGASSERIEPAQLELLQLSAAPLTDTPDVQALPSPPEEIDVPTNSVATTRESSWSKSAMSSFAQFE